MGMHLKIRLLPLNKLRYLTNATEDIEQKEDDLLFLRSQVC